MLEIYRDYIRSNTRFEAQDRNLLISSDGPLSTYYAPFEYIQPSAKVVILGITPGPTQAVNALQTLAAELRAGTEDQLALARAKVHGSFSGPMRTNLVQMLNHIGMQEKLGLVSAAALFDPACGLAHFTSVLRNPVYLDGKPYNGKPAVLGHSYLEPMMKPALGFEATVLRNAIWIPLGLVPTAVLKQQVKSGALRAEQVLTDIPHPSPLNAERQAYFLGRKPRLALSSKTNPDKLDAQLVACREQVLGLVLG